ncbi:Kdo hydroxylase family protein [Nitrosomonas communis]|uniref:3-deoxy-D-manno-oct-2-ulosonic acid (Kdo) hydroxylase n=1 Tax=Nitrosomonas communis TaxID=44574 RepID=A0A1I4NYV6_9PROT|nr:Kdo hydroxylase family protein [Nitrosomonas communis]SFM20712.1 3-deoxy-D-manno-oct-2-ulosonic acid (Kdo) hydroxylase [Nitrosomonas communis]
MLRIFTNINPANGPRIWQLGEPFEPFMRRFLPAVRLSNQVGFSLFLLTSALLTEQKPNTTST